MNANDLKTILEKHKMWLNDEDGGEMANLRWANLSGANLRWVQHIESARNLFYPLTCPEKGEYTAFKEVDDKIVELRIPADAKRLSSTKRKCRANKAVVVSITELDGTPAGDEVCSDYDADFVYRVGETVEVQNFDENRWNECAPGIHHYITREEAVRH